MNKFMLYLAGPITGLAYGSTVNWRDYVKRNIDPGIVPLSPMRNKEYLSTETTVADSYESIATSSSRGITARDRFDCQRADAILVNFLGVDKVSIGSVMEIAWADAARKPIILVMDPESVHNHAMIRGVASFIVSTLDEGIAIAESVLLPEVSQSSMLRMKGKHLPMISSV